MEEEEIVTVNQVNTLLLKKYDTISPETSNKK